MQQQEVKQPKLCYSIKAMIDATSFSRSYFFDAIKHDRIKTFKLKNRRFVLHDDLVAFVRQEAEG